MASGILRDGDAVVTSHGFIFYVFGYQHPNGGYNAFLKYVPEEHSALFDVDWLDIRWRLKDSTLLRPRELYAPEVYPRFIEAFRRHFPEYIRFSQGLDRWMITVPQKLIERAYRPSRQLTLIMRRGPSDPLEEKALALIRLLSEASSVPLGFFGVHGSISLGMHHEGSDIDVAVYGGSHFRWVKRALVKLEAEEALALKRGTRLEKKRLNRGIFEDVDFVVNATRLLSEIPGISLIFKPVREVEVECRCVSADEAVFRPAIYLVEGCEELSGSYPEVEGVSQVVSMIGLYRGVVEAGEMMRARGVLEEVIEEPGSGYLRVVVGSGSPGEYLDWIGS
ncbi:MAG: nucleotidyltransferase domain-containing protein [Candidatus Bathyarchaeota archaeon]|nr:nucleotidyltransferase domain-containing protein [Candidatus Bathyarchaeota archaeon]